MPQIPEWFVWGVSGIIGFTALGTVFLTFFPINVERDESVTRKPPKCP